MITLGLIGNGFVGGAARQLECSKNFADWRIKMFSNKRFDKRH